MLKLCRKSWKQTPAQNPTPPRPVSSLETTADTWTEHELPPLCSTCLGCANSLYAGAFCFFLEVDLALDG